MVHKCIYSLKTSDETEFATQEHVIPAFLGGMKKLPIGYVSDDVNKMFSKLELSFARETDIAIPRMFVGPGKRGNLNPAKASPSKVHIFQYEDGLGFGLGYIKLGAPYPIDQIHVFQGSANVRFSLSPIEGSSNSELLSNFSSKLTSLNTESSIKVLPDENLDKLEYIFGYSDGKWYLAINPTRCAGEAKDYILRFVQSIMLANRNGAVTMPNDMDEIGIKSSQIVSHFDFEIDLNNYYRVIAKTALNCLAHLKDNQFVLKPEFDSIRKAIYDDLDMSGYFGVLDSKTRGEHGSFADIFKKLDSLGGRGLGDQYHAIIFFSVMGAQMCIVGFYGLDNPYVIKLTEAATEPVLDGFFCDWRARTELNLLEYIEAITGRDGYLDVSE